MRKSYLLAAAVALLALGWILSGRLSAPEKAPLSTQEAASAPQPQVRVRLSRARAKRNEIILLGRTQAVRSVDLRAETAGRVARVHKDRGQRVARGEAIVTLALDDREARRVEARARLRQREIEFQAARALSAREFRSKTKLAEAGALLDQAKAALEGIRLDIARTRIGAPFAGILESRPAEIGDYLAVGGKVARIVDLDPILVAGFVTERDIGQIRIGTRARARLVTGREITGRIRFVSAVADSLTRTFKVEMAASNPDGAVLGGLTAELSLDLGTVSAHLVSPAVLTLSDQGAIGVKVVDADRRVRFHGVEIVGDGPDGMWLTGLADTLTLITVGQEFVRVGQEVIAVPERSQPLTNREGGAS